MVLLILIGIISLLFPILMSVFVLGNYFIILWTCLTPIIYFLIIILITLLYTMLATNTSPFSKIKHYVIYAVSLFSEKFIFNLKIKVHNKQNIPKSSSLLTVYANHKSNLDPIYVIHIFKGKVPISFTPKSDLYNYIILRNWLKSLDSLKIDRNNDRNTVKALFNAIQNAKKGLVYTIFPEGGIKDRSIDKMVDTLKPGAFKIAQKAKTDILTVSIIGSKDVRKKTIFRPRRVDIVVNKIIRYNDYKDLNSVELGKIVHQQINDSILDFKKRGEKYEND